MSASTFEHYLDAIWIGPFAGLIVFGAVRWYLRRRRAPVRSSLTRAVIDFYAASFSACALVPFIYFGFSTPVLSSFGVPKSPAAVGSAEQILKYLQMYNRELVTASLAVQWLCLFVALVLASAIRLSREFEAHVRNLESGNHPTPRTTSDAMVPPEP